MSEIRRAKILFITDDEDEAKMIELFLRDRREDLVIICNLNDQTLSDFTHQKLDLILFDSRYFFSDTSHNYQALRRIPEFINIPVILWRITKSRHKIYPIGQSLGVHGCIDYVYDIENHLLKARDLVLAGETYYPT